MYILSINMWFQKLMKQFFFGIDNVVYNFISTIYDLLISISRTSILSQADIIDMADRIYNLLAIFMIFKVTLSLITYVVNPDDFSDKSKGVSKLAMNIIISLGLLILTPYIFSMAYRVQTIILEDNTMAALIFSEKMEGEASNSINTAGDEMAFLTMSAFLSPNLSITELQNCLQLTEKDSDGNIKFNKNCSGLGDNYEYSDKPPLNSLAGLTKNKEQTKKNENFTKETLQNYVVGIENQNLGLMFRQNIVTATDIENENFIFEYKYLFSTVVGVIIILLLLSFCMDIGLRSIKLAFLQLIAPIPILSYVDPKSGKDGMFKKWYQMCFKTYLSLFIRLLALYFAIYIIGRLDKMVDIVDGTYQSNIFIKIFVLIGALMFAKQLPKILEGLGIKLDGDGKFTLNPLRKMENEALGGKFLKKPNDALARFAKGGFGAGTMSRKLMSGANAAVHGKGFANGFNRYKGGHGKWVDKQREAYLPYGLEASKKKREGRENLAMKDKMFSKGQQLYNQYNEGKTIEKAFSNQSYADSYINVNKQKQKMYGWQREVEKRRSTLNSAESVLAQKKAEGLKGDALQEYVDAVNDARKNFDQASIQSGSAQAAYELSKSKHEDMKKVYTKDAEIEESLDFYKKNSGLSFDQEITYESENESKTPKNPNDDSNSVDDSEIIFNDAENENTSIPEDVMERVNETTGVSRESVSENGAPTADDSALIDFFEANTTEEEKKRRIEVEKRIAEIKAEIEELKYKKSIEPDGETWRKITQQINDLNKELEYLKKQL